MFEALAHHGQFWQFTKVTSVGFEPTPTKTTALTLRLRPLGHDVMVAGRHGFI